MTDAPSPLDPADGPSCAFTPVPRRRNRHDGWTPDRQRDFIAALADTGSVKAAAQMVGMTSESAYQLRRQAEAESFAAAWLAALDHGIRRLEDIALERAIHGVEVPVYSYGKLVGTRRIFNDRLLMFMLRNRARDRFTPYAGHEQPPPPVDMRGRPDSPDAIARVTEVLAEIRRRRAEQDPAYAKWQEGRLE